MTRAVLSAERVRSKNTEMWLVNQVKLKKMWDSDHENEICRRGFVNSFALKALLFVLGMS